ncbi:MAG: M20 family metallopeptidase [Chloroflexi bacterium]|nr:M20 family metallopeptidase [Chloroflexota bacterium]
MTDHPADLVTTAELDRLTAHMSDRLPAYLADLQRLVDIDCGSYTKVGVDEVGAWVQAAFGELGMRVEVTPHETLGDTVVGSLGKGTGGPTVMLIGHMDTVFDPGTVAERPFRIDGDRALGPGVSDMKGGLLAGLYALRCLRDLAQAGDVPWPPVGRVIYVSNPDEEIGSPSSTPIIGAQAADADLALVLEGGRANGDFVSSRKGIMDLELRITGRAAHAGVEPEKGRSAILEAAHKIQALHALNGRWPGVTVNAGVMRGGTRPNVVAAEAMLQVDIRAVQRAALEEAEAAVRAIAAESSVPDTTCEVSLMGRFWPMEKLERSGRLVEHAIGLAGQLGFPLKDAATGGASDANTTSGLGVASIDGLGPIGGNDHAPTEYLEVGSIVPRTVLVAGIILAAGRDPVISAWAEDRRARS